MQTLIRKEEVLGETKVRWSIHVVDTHIHIDLRGVQVRVKVE